MKEINKLFCRSCGVSDTINILRLGNFYLSKFVSNTEKYNTRRFPLELIQCSKCSLIQLSKSVAKKFLYTDNYGYRSGINNTMKQELRNIVNEAKKFCNLSKGSIVLDIGSNDGTLLKTYRSNNILKVGFDPVSKFSSFYNNKDEKFINNYFNKKEFKKLCGINKAQIITAISMFYDLEDPNKFISDIKECLDDDGILVIQQNYLASMIKYNAFDNIVHEHLEYYSLYSLEKLLLKHGLRVFDIKLNNLNGGSFRTYIDFIDSKRKTSYRVQNLRNRERKDKLMTEKPYLDFTKRIIQLRKKTLKFIKSEIKKNKTIFIYGASTRGNTLIQFYGLNHKLISYAVERNPEKWGKTILAGKIPIISEKHARKLMPDYMLVLPWYFREEIIAREKDYLKKGGKLIFPLPDLNIVRTK